VSGHEEWEFVYRVPEASRLVGTGDWRYSSRVERQPGMPPTTAVTVEIAVPQGACITSVDGVSRSSTVSAVRSWSLTRDLDLRVGYSFDPSRCP
jgi:hypothetical protein